MKPRYRWPAAELIETTRLELEPLRVAHADEVAAAFDDAQLHTYIGGSPSSAEQLRGQYARQVVGHSADGSQGWLNWVSRHRRSGAVVGTVQATLHEESGRLVAELAWVVRTSCQRQGYAVEAATEMATWLRSRDVVALRAHIHPAHAASLGVARKIGLAETEVIIDGETRWVSSPPS